MPATSIVWLPPNNAYLKGVKVESCRVDLLLGIEVRQLHCSLCKERSIHCITSSALARTNLKSRRIDLLVELEVCQLDRPPAKKGGVDGKFDGVDVGQI